MGLPYNSGTGNAAGVGYREEQIHTASGLRIAHCGGVIGTNRVGIQALKAFGAASSSTWRSVKVAADWKGRLPVPMTPCINVIATVTSAPGNLVIRFRARGQDQFGASIVEQTPWMTFATTSTAFFMLIYLSKVFSFLDDLEWQSADVLSTGEIGVGWTAIIDKFNASAATISVSLAGAGASNTSVQFAGSSNWGIGTPLRIAPYGASEPFAKPEVLGASGALLYSSYGPTVIGTPALFPPATSTVDGFVLGQNTSGWEGTPHKIGFSDHDEVDAMSLDISLGGSSQSASVTPATLAQLGADTLELSFTIRSTVGTRRGARATPVVNPG